jgi:hypothetical protein
MRHTKILTAVVIVQSVLLGIAWLGPIAQPALGQIPDSGAQRSQMLQEMQATNAKLDKIIESLDGGNLQVRIAKSDDKQGK